MKRPSSYDFLGNEFLLWLWWTLETQADTIELADKSEVAVMRIARSRWNVRKGYSGKETIVAEAPVRLPKRIMRSSRGSCHARAGLLLVRGAAQYEFALQAETFGVSGGRIKLAENDEQVDPLGDVRVDSLRSLAETIDLLFAAFCERGWAKPGTAT